MTLGIGPAGTGKTYLAVAMAVNAFRAKEVNRNHPAPAPPSKRAKSSAFSPVTCNRRSTPNCARSTTHCSRCRAPDSHQKDVERGNIEIAPLAYMRGRTLDDNSFVILDEAQNTTPEQMKMFLTRLGFHSKMVVTGDVTQIDLPSHQKKRSERGHAHSQRR